jgi:hypothetical protein
MRKAMTSLQNLRLLGRSAGLLSSGVPEKWKKRPDEIMNFTQMLTLRDLSLRSRFPTSRHARDLRPLTTFETYSIHYNRK